MPADTWEVTFSSFFLSPPFSPFIYFHLSLLFFFFPSFSARGGFGLVCARAYKIWTRTSVFFGNVYFRGVLGSDYDRPRMKLVLRVDETGCGFYGAAYDGAWVEWEVSGINTEVDLVGYLWLFWWSCLMKNNVSSLYVFFYITIKMRKNRFLVSLSSLPLDLLVYAQIFIFISKLYQRKYLK